MAISSSLTKLVFISFIILSIFTSKTLSVSIDCSPKTNNKCNDKAAAFPLKIIAIFAILFAGIIGVFTPLFTKSAPALKHTYRKNVIVVIKACASGVILATGFMHVLPDAFEMLSADCLDNDPWHIISFAGFVTMLSAVVALMVDSLGTSLFGKKFAIGVNQEIQMSENDLEIDSRVTPGHYHGHYNQQTDSSAAPGHFRGHNNQQTDSRDAPGHFRGHNNQQIDSRDASGQIHGDNNQEVNSGMEEGSQLLRNRVIAVVLEVAVIFHSMVIGITLGASNNICTLKSLLPALCFHQLFVGMGLGGFFLQADYSFLKRTTLAFLFSVMTPLGIVLGLMVTHEENSSPAKTIALGLLNACSAGLLIYMALVDLLAAEFMGPKLQGHIKLQIQSYVALLMGIGSMALISRWA